MLPRARSVRHAAALVTIVLLAGACAASPSAPQRVDRVVAPIDRGTSVPGSPVTTTTAEPADDVEVVLDPATAAGETSTGIDLGVTHTQHSADSWGAPDAVARARALLPEVAGIQNQHLYGWGTLNPNPSPGVYDWRSLDARVELMRQTGGTPVITLCCAPDWMKGAAPGTTDWTRLEVAPTERYFDDFAALARAVAIRYPDVRHFQVWNEMKGFWDAERNRWDHEAYTDLYNRVYQELKAIDPSIQVGGPYVVIGSWADAASASHPSALRGPWGTADARDLDAVDYWLDHADGADFVAVDAWTGTRDQGLQDDEFTATTKLRDVGRWIRQRTDLPIWWSEWYVTPVYPQPVGGDWTTQRIAALVARSAIEMSLGGGSVALHWAPQPEATACGACLWTDTSVADGGQMTATAAAVRLVRQHLAGRALQVLAHGVDGLTAVATDDAVVIVNELGRDRRVSIDGTPLTVGPHAVVVHPL